MAAALKKISKGEKVNAETLQEGLPQLLAYKFFFGFINHNKKYLGSYFYIRTTWHCRMISLYGIGHDSFLNVFMFGCASIDIISPIILVYTSAPSTLNIFEICIWHTSFNSWHFTHNCCLHFQLYIRVTNTVCIGNT